MSARPALLFAACASSACTAADPGGGVEGVSTLADGEGSLEDYPAGPYGVELGEVLPPLSFLAGDGAVVEVSAAYGSGADALLLFMTTAWCSPCRGDAEDLRQPVAAYGDAVIAYGVLFEDLYGANASAQTAADYNALVSSFEFLADPERGVDALFAVSAPLPRVLVVDPYDMRVALRRTGHDNPAILAALEALAGG